MSDNENDIISGICIIVDEETSQEILVKAEDLEFEDTEVDEREMGNEIIYRGSCNIEINGEEKEFSVEACEYPEGQFNSFSIYIDDEDISVTNYFSLKQNFSYDMTLRESYEQDDEC